MPEFNIKGTEKEAEEKARQLPDPTGYKILTMVPKVEKTFGSQIQKADETVRVEEQTSVVLFVCKLGPDAYADRTKFPSGPWCKQGDFVVTRTYAGTRFRIHDTEFRLINDDTVEGTVQDPRGIDRA
jgi:co-chaperonin GroES (HSP10)